MKKYFFSLLAIVLFLSITGCGNNSDNSFNEESKNDETSSTVTSDNSTSSDLKLYSDSTKIVFESENIRYVFYYSGEKITGYLTYINYETAELANYALQILERNETIKKAYTQGKYLIVEYNESEYEDLTVTSLRAAYSMMKEVKE